MQVKIIPVGMLHTNCCLIIDEETKLCAIIDPGANSEKLMKIVGDLGLEVDSIFLTHGHFDHILAAPEIQRQSGAKLYIHADDEYMLEPEYACHAGYIREEYAKPKITGYFTDGMKLKVGGLECTVLHTPGHSQGSCVILCGDTMFSGDTLFRQSCGRTDLGGGSQADMMASLARLAALDGNYKVYPGHMDATTLDEERASNPYMPE